MTLEEEKRFLLLLSSFDLQKRKSELTKSQVLDNIYSQHWILLSNKDNELKSNRNELVWRNDLAFVRKHLEQQGFYVFGKRNNWGITDVGRTELERLNLIVQKTSDFSKITNEAKLYAAHILDTIDEKNTVLNIDINEDEIFQNITGSEKLAFIKIRVNQGDIRKNALKKYNCKCALCGLKMKELLVASHIKSWADSTPTEKGNINNIILLCSNHNALFDKHLISFDEKGKILINNKMDDFDKKISNVSDNMQLSFILNSEMNEFMTYHRNKFFSINFE